jgi:hypothetical protein
LGQVAPIEQLKEKYGKNGVEFVVVYVREPHPGEPAYRQYVQPQNLEQRRQYARELATTRHMKATVVVDTMDDTVSEQFGSLPNMVYVIDRDGTVAYKATWTMAEKIDQVLGVLTAENSAATQVSA